MAFANRRTDCVLVDEEGNHWTCTLRWAGRNRNECYLGGGWLQFAQDKGLVEGSNILFRVSREDNATTHVKVVS